MKRYIKASINEDVLSTIKSEIEDYIMEYYGELGYEEDEILHPDCEIQEQSNKDGKSVYKVSISLDAVDEEDADDICDELNTLTGFNGLPVKLYKDFSYDGEYTFTGFIIER